MNDENNEENEHQPVGFFVPGFSPPTPEQIEQMRMQNVTLAHETRAFFDSLDADQLKKFIGILRTCDNSGTDAINYFIGIGIGWLDQKHNLCIACGLDHDKELGEMSGSVSEPEPQKHPADVVRDLDADYALDCAEYGVEPMPKHFPKVKCVNCGMESVSLEDRKLRKPAVEGCVGCQEKSAWG